MQGDAGGRVSQGPVELVAQNESDRPLYVSLGWVVGSGFSCDREGGDGFEDCSFYKEGCVQACSDESEGAHCCVACSDIVSTVQEVRPGARYSYLWSGEEQLIDTQHCADNCPCYWLVDPLAGRYRASICMSDAFSCINPPCAPPNDEGRIEFAVPAGNEFCSSREFDIPYGQRTLVLKLD